MISSCSRLTLAGILLCCVLTGCGKSDFAPGGSTLTLVVDPQTVALHGTATLTATVMLNGAPVSDGTVVRFFVSQGSGTISPPSSTTQGGIATAIFHATNFAADVTIDASSGSATAEVKVTVASTANQQIALSANPAALPNGGGTTTLTATVTDGSGNPQKGVRILFSTDQGTLQSHGNFVSTDAAGEANDTLTTTLTATVTAAIAGSDISPATLTVDVGSVTITCAFTVSPTAPAVGALVTFTDTSDDPASRIRSYFWDFGDGATSQSATAQHAYSTAGTYKVGHVVIDTSGNSINCDPVSLIVGGS